MRRSRRLRFTRRIARRRNSGIRIDLRATRASGWKRKSGSSAFRRPTRHFASTSRIRRERHATLSSLLRFNRNPRARRFSSAMRRAVLPRQISLTMFGKSSLTRIWTARRFRLALSICRRGALQFAIHSIGKHRMYVRDALGNSFGDLVCGPGKHQARRSAKMRSRARGKELRRRLRGRRRGIRSRSIDWTEPVLHVHRPSG